MKSKEPTFKRYMLSTSTKPGFTKPGQSYDQLLGRLSPSYHMSEGPSQQSRGFNKTDIRRVIRIGICRRYPNFGVNQSKIGNGYDDDDAGRLLEVLTMQILRCPSRGHSFIPFLFISGKKLVGRICPFRDFFVSFRNFESFCQMFQLLHSEFIVQHL